jgi:hypothetical protein
VPRRTLAELLHLAAGLALTVLIFRLAAWSYPLGRETIGLVGWGAAVVVLAMAIDPLRRAWAADRRQDDPR